VFFIPYSVVFASHGERESYGRHNDRTHSQTVAQVGAKVICIYICRPSAGVSLAIALDGCESCTVEEARNREAEPAEIPNTASVPNTYVNPRFLNLDLGQHHFVYRLSNIFGSGPKSTSY
jgi:hypothetical protein